jgi:hypothetical protein
LYASWIIKYFGGGEPGNVFFKDVEIKPNDNELDLNRSMFKAKCMKIDASKGEITV